jgi:hypothetical protein
MAFPFPLGTTRIFTPQELKALRQVVIKKVFTQSIGTTTAPGFDVVAEQLNQINQVLSRTATNEQTAYENGTVTTSATGNSNLLTRQAERALTQVLGRSPGRGASGFIQALNSTFPTGKNDRVLFTPSRSIVSMYSPDGEGNQVISGKNGSGLTGQLSVAQANLYRQASIIVVDSLKVLATIEPFDPSADIDAVEALRSLIQTQMQSLLEEFGRLDRPRPNRVNSYLSAMTTSIADIGTRARLSGTSPFPVTSEDESQVAAFELVNNYITTLKTIWQQYLNLKTSTAATLSANYSDRLSRVSILLPVIADSNASFMAAMDSVGFTESERRSDAALFTELTELSPPQFTLSIDSRALLPSNISSIGNVELPNITVNDFNEWLDRFATIEAPSVLADSGRFGLDFVTDQADTLFWTIAFVLDFIAFDTAAQPTTPRGTAGIPGAILDDIFAFDRVEQALKELAFQLDALASLSEP